MLRILPKNLVSMYYNKLLDIYSGDDLDLYCEDGVIRQLYEAELTNLVGLLRKI